MTVLRAEHASLWRFRWLRALIVIDLLGLGLAFTWSVALVPLPVGRLFGASLAVAAVISFFILRPTTPFPRLMLLDRSTFAPLAAVVGVLVVMAALREYYSGMVLLKFAVGWMAWMVTNRLVLRVLSPVPNIVAVGDTRSGSELAEAKLARVTPCLRPPATIAGWDAVVVDPWRELDREWLAWLSAADMAGVPVLNGRTVVERLTGRIDVESLDGRWAAEVFHGISVYVAWKRVIDVIATAVAAPVLVPIGAVVALCVRLDGPGPVLYVQERVGLDGNVFRMFKFRTMREVASGRGAQFADADDNRITRVGRWLRTYRLDELPQFLNVLRGDMSIIGPRPEQVEFARTFAATIPMYSLRHNVRPGITGWAQVQAGYAASEESTRLKLRYDFYYLKYISWRTDARIVLETVRTILTGFGAR